MIETACFVSRDGIKPIGLKNYPKEVVGLISAVKNYEQLTVEAALTGDKDIALKALLAHPLVREYDIAKPLLDEMLEAHKEYLPQFFKDEKIVIAASGSSKNVAMVVQALLSKDIEIVVDTPF